MPDGESTVNWIKLLYPKPKFNVWGLPPWLAAIHTKALLVAYYIAQTLGLFGLAIAYLTVIFPISLFVRLRHKDWLDLKWKTGSPSYLKRSEPVSKIDFSWMY